MDFYSCPYKYVIQFAYLDNIAVIYECDLTEEECLMGQCDIDESDVEIIWMENHKLGD